MKALEKKVRYCIEEGNMTGANMQPLARLIIKSIRPVSKTAPSQAG